MHPLLVPDLSSASLLEVALALRWSAPELTVALAGQAGRVARAGGDRVTALGAEQAALAGLNQLDRGVVMVPSAVAALAEAGRCGEDLLAGSLQVELVTAAAEFAASDATTLLAGVAERPGFPEDLRIAALVQHAQLAAGRGDRSGVDLARQRCEPLLGRRPDRCDRVTLDRARLILADARCRRREGAPGEAVQAAREGLALLAELADPEADAGRIRAVLTSEAVGALLDLGRTDDGVRTARGVLTGPVTPAAAAPVGWLRLTLVNRVHLPADELVVAARVLTPAVQAARAGHDLLLAACLTALSRVAEARGQVTEALRQEREARDAERRGREVVERARVRLAVWLVSGEAHSEPPAVLDVPRSAPTSRLDRQEDAAPVESASAEGPPAGVARREAHRPDGADAPSGRHGRSDGQPVMLPGGQPVRRGSGGRRHADRDPAPPEAAAPGTGVQHSVDARWPNGGPGETALGLADLLAEAMAAYREGRPNRPSHPAARK